MRRRADGQWCAAGGVQADRAWPAGCLARCAAILRGRLCAVRGEAAGLRAVLRRCLCVVREVVGAPDYERYLEHHARCHPGAAPLDRRGFYAEFVTRRFGPGPTRCC